MLVELNTTQMAILHDLVAGECRLMEEIPGYPVLDEPSESLYSYLCELDGLFKHTLMPAGDPVLLERINKMLPADEYPGPLEELLKMDFTEKEKKD